MGLRLGRGDVTKRGAIIGHSREQLYRKNEFSSANESKLVQSDKLGKRTVKSSRGLNRTATDGFQKSQSSVFLRLSFFFSPSQPHGRHGHRGHVVACGFAQLHSATGSFL